jgi:putative chitinase
MTLEQLKKIMLYAGPRADRFYLPLCAAMEEFGIDTPARQAAFLAQIAHESGALRYVKEIASGEAYDTGRLAKRLGNTPDKDGDGQKYKGRGLIQITGRANYSACSQALFGDDRLLSNPEILETTESACRSAGWFWQTMNLNSLADIGGFRAITRAINGGFNGYEDRLSYYERAKGVLA